MRGRVGWGVAIARLSTSLFEHFRRHAPADLDKPALLHPDGRRTSYRALFGRGSQVAAAFRGLGVRPGAGVAVQAEKCEDLLAVYLGSLQTGSVFLPLNPESTADEVRYVLADSGAEVFLCPPERLGEMRPLARETGVRHVQSLAVDGCSGTFQALLKDANLKAETPSPRPSPPERGRGGSFSPSPLEGTGRSAAGDRGALPLETGGGEDGLAAVLYTSGTTGKPKGAMLTHGNLIANVEALHQAWGWREDDVLLHALPLFHIHGLFVAVNGALRSGATIILLPRFDLDLVLRYLPESSVFMGVPTMYHRLAGDARLTPEVCRSVRLFVSGSAPLSVQDFAAFQERSGHSILERYGMTETGMNISNPLDGVRKPGSVGLPLPAVEARIVHQETLEDVGAGEVGEVWLRGPSVFIGYFGQPEVTAEAFVDGWFRTGDLARQDEDGYYWLVGRARDLIITGGLNVYPAEVESVLNDIEGVEESAVIGLADAEFGERVAAIVVRSREGPVPGAEAVMAAARARLAPYKCPRRIEFVDALPRNAMGKVEKDRLRLMFGS